MKKTIRLSSDKNWEFLDTGVNSAAKNMAIDRKLLDDLDKISKPIFHAYDWIAPSITYGYFTAPENGLHLDRLLEKGIEIAKRPTGGGYTLHFGDFAFSILIPASSSFYSKNTLENYALINSAIGKTLERAFNIPLTKLLENCIPCNTPARFCMAHPVKNDLIIDGRKVSGGAQRRTRYGYLHQGAICLSLPQPENLKDIIKNFDAYWHLITKNSFPLADTFGSQQEIRDVLVSELFKTLNSME